MMMKIAEDIDQKCENTSSQKSNYNFHIFPCTILIYGEYPARQINNKTTTNIWFKKK